MHLRLKGGHSRSCPTCGKYPTKKCFACKKTCGYGPDEVTCGTIGCKFYGHTNEVEQAYEIKHTYHLTYMCYSVFPHSTSNVQNARRRTKISASCAIDVSKWPFHHKRRFKFFAVEPAFMRTILPNGIHDDKWKIIYF